MRIKIIKNGLLQVWYISFNTLQKSTISTYILNIQEIYEIASTGQPVTQNCTSKHTNAVICQFIQIHKVMKKSRLFTDWEKQDFTIRRKSKTENTDLTARERTYKT